MHPLESLDQHCWQLCVNTWLTGSTNKYSHRGRSRVGSGCREKPLICRKTTPPPPPPKKKKTTSREQMQPSSPSTDSSWCLWMSAHARLLHIYHLHHLCNHHHYHHTLLSPFNLFLFVSAVSVLKKVFYIQKSPAAETLNWDEIRRLVASAPAVTLFQLRPRYDTV